MPFSVIDPKNGTIFFQKRYSPVILNYYKNSLFCSAFYLFFHYIFYKNM